MRASLTWPVNFLIVLVVATGMCFSANRAAAGSVLRTRPQASEEAIRNFPDVLGRGPTKFDAQRDALLKAQKIIVQHLRSLEPPVTWTPSRTFIRDHLLGEPMPMPGEKQKVDEVDVKCWKWPLSITSETWTIMKEADRKERAQRLQAERIQRMEGRMILLGKLLAALVALLGVVAGYVRLDELTKGYYTGRLRLAALAVLAIALGLVFQVPR